MVRVKQTHMQYTWLLFDADGTLFDYDAAERQALTLTFAEFERACSAEAHRMYREINERMWLDFEQGKTTAARIKTERFARLFEALDADAPAEIRLDPAEFANRYLANLGTRTDLMPDAEPVLQALRSRAHLALITNGLTVVQRARLAHSGLGHYFEAVVISDEEGVSKPDPGIFRIAFDRMGSPCKDEVLMVGDGLTSDIRGANGFGIDACWYNPEGKPPMPGVHYKYEIRNLTELLGLCRS
jgi:2-haloacid dehalogenase